MSHCILFSHLFICWFSHLLYHSCVTRFPFYDTQNINRPLETSWDLKCLNTSNLKDPYAEMFQLYFEKLLVNIPRDLLAGCNAKSDIRFVYSAMHGVGYKFVEKALEIANLKPLIPVLEQRDADPDFPTVKFPNPEEGKSSLTLSFLLAQETKTNIILANDPDADRLACAEFNEE